MPHGVFKCYYVAMFKRTNSMDMADVCNAIVLCNDGTTCIKHPRVPVRHGQ